MIPKKIHYCWFGRKPLPDNVKQYILTWKTRCPEYEIIEWNESNFNINDNRYCREAYDAKKWAFVSDYARLKIIYEHGGIYMDTDVEVRKSYNSLLYDPLFCCFEDAENVSIGTLGAEKHHPFIKKILEKYEVRTFVKSDGTYDMTTNLKEITSTMVNDYGLKLNGGHQILRDGINVYPMEYFIAKKYKTGELVITKETFAIHHYEGSWLNIESKLIRKRYQKIYLRLYWIPCHLLRSKISTLVAMVGTVGISSVFSLIKNKYKKRR